ncbi:protein Mpv17-like [Gigantopelta aegis]|uniref:protein Mpv17-like n=1 Tax=Gigantopelta aegis TaxID=1735272 RepID=UPI001B88CB3F|nr:protein Mpv17-like [Gigantopelta aegis]
MAGIWSRYMRMLEKYPLLTTAGTTGVLASTGDVASQMIIEKRGRNYDPVRSARFLVFGCVCLGPILRGWYFVLDKAFRGSRLAPIKMVLADQLLFAPNILWIFLTGMAALRGESVEQIKTMLKRDYKSVLLNNYKLWPAAQIINFYFMPLHHRVLFVNFVALGWNTYLAWVSERHHP